MDNLKNGTKLSFKDIFSKKISGYRKVCTEDMGQSIQILLTTSEESDCSESEQPKAEFEKVSAQLVPSADLNVKVRLLFHFHFFISIVYASFDPRY